MRKIFLMATILIAVFSATAFAADNNFYEYTSATYNYKIKCPVKPVAVKHFKNQRGELLIFANDGDKIILGYKILLDAFNTNSVPNFNRDRKRIRDAYVEKLRSENLYEYIAIKHIGTNNKGVVAITSGGKSAFTFFRTKSGRCISIQLMADNFNENNFNDYKKAVSSFRDK